MINITLHTLFTNLVEPYFSEALLAKAVERGLIDVHVRDLRRFANNPSNRVDDAPYGGGAGMVIRVDVAANAIAETRAEAAQRSPQAKPRVILLSPAGKPLTQTLVEDLAQEEEIVLISGRYEGFDARVEQLVDEEISIGDYVLMGGELPALVIIEALARLIPGALGEAESYEQDSFSSGLLDYPEFTRPPEFDDMDVPEVLRSGHHGNIATWRREQALLRTLERRPDLLDSADLTAADRTFLTKIKK